MELDERTVSHDEASSWLGFVGEYRTDDMLSNGGDGSTRCSSEKEMRTSSSSTRERGCTYHS